MPNGNLEKWLHSHSCVLDITQRLDIMIDLACALDYLVVIPSVVLGSENPSTTDSQRPKYGLGGSVSTSCDVYSYEIMLMETFTGKKPTDEMFAG
ncbi:hypothetical protein RJ640_029410 [Escallonia rubra]|uniref:Uncharacterized protein n=1 Tax=Escallonia rubra TaxID=112253 RepID=A0AA88U4I0_9ASTE|nr:hypothetical protein RJ640_029410 [Escallonia rubra]